ncbi:MAG: hypothetical protein EXS16_02985 [Gemmataceae bacterium]|nr:hypothetical protein [Gemmataceae bacterium]
MQITKGRKYEIAKEKLKRIFLVFAISLFRDPYLLWLSRYNGNGLKAALSSSLTPTTKVQAGSVSDGLEKSVAYASGS